MIEGGQRKIAKMFMVNRVELMTVDHVFDVRHFDHHYAVVLQQILEAINEAVEIGNMRQYVIRVHDIENESDKLYRKALTDLFNAPNPDPLNVIKWKEIYDRVEIAVDKCESVADIVESVVVKYA